MTGPMLRPEWLSPQRTALLLIDMQVDFAAPDGVMAGLGFDMRAPQAAIARADRLAAAARAAGVPLVFSRFVTVPGRERPTEREARERRGLPAPDLCLEGRPGADFLGPQPREDDLVVTKYRFSVFPGTGLDTALKARGVDTLVLCGLTTECCVGSSAWDAFERDFHVFLAADACAAYEDDLHHTTLKGLELSGAVIAQSADVIGAWK